MKYLLLLLIISTTALADSSSMNLQIPSSPGTYASDKFRAGDLDCSNAIGSASNFEMGVTGIIDNASSLSGSDPANPSTKDIGVYARIVVPLDAPRERINCNTLYQLELTKKRYEIIKLETEIQKLKQLQFEN
jgi:hypothetical protein